MAENLRDALSAVFAGYSGAPGVVAGEDVPEAIAEELGVSPEAFSSALAIFRRAQDHLRNGRWAEYGEAMDALDELEGLGQTALMTIHKSKGLEFHTMIFYGLDNSTWWSLTPSRIEELNSFFVAFTRARQRVFFTMCTERGQPVDWIESLLAPAGVQRIDSCGCSS